jgi:hypothetical protein
VILATEGTENTETISVHSVSSVVITDVDPANLENALGL